MDACFDAAAVVIGQWAYTNASPGTDPCCDVRARLRHVREEEARVKLQLFSVEDILNPQPHAATVVHALLFWIDEADKASVRGAAKPPFSRPDGSPIFPPDEEWWLTSFDKRAEHQRRPDLAGDTVPDEDLTLDPADAGVASSQASSSDEAGEDEAYAATDVEDDDEAYPEVVATRAFTVATTKADVRSMLARNPSAHANDATSAASVFAAALAKTSAPATVPAQKPADFASADGSPEHGDDEEAYPEVASAAADGSPEEADDDEAYPEAAPATVPPETAGSDQEVSLPSAESSVPPQKQRVELSPARPVPDDIAELAAQTVPARLRRAVLRKTSATDTARESLRVSLDSIHDLPADMRIALKRSDAHMSVVDASALPAPSEARAVPQPRRPGSLYIRRQT